MVMATESQFHVLAVDDSLIDRKLIERLLRNSSYQGIYLFIFLFNFGLWSINCSSSPGNKCCVHILMYPLVKKVSFWIINVEKFLFFWQLLQLILVTKLWNFWVCLKMTTAAAQEVRLQFLQTPISNRRLVPIFSFLVKRKSCFLFYSWPEHCIWTVWAGSGSKSHNYRLLYAWYHWLRSAQKSQGIVITEEHTCGDYVIGERPFKNQQVNSLKKAVFLPNP